MKFMDLFRACKASRKPTAYETASGSHVVGPRTAGKRTASMLSKLLRGLAGRAKG